MTRQIRIELLKLRTNRTTYGLGLAAMAVTALFATLEASRAGRRVPPVSTAAGLSTVSTATGVAVVLAAVLGVIAASGEYRYTSATLTYLATPDRSRVLVAKAAAAAIVGFTYGALAALVATSVALGFVAAHHDHLAVGAGTMASHLLGAGIGAALVAALGVAIGSLVRAQVPGIVGILVWCLVLESLLGGAVTGLRPYLPYTAAASLGGSKPGASAFGPGYTDSGPHALPFIAGAALIAALAGLLGLLAARATVRADIT